MVSFFGERRNDAYLSTTITCFVFFLWSFLFGFHRDGSLLRSPARVSPSCLWQLGSPSGAAPPAPSRTSQQNWVAFAESDRRTQRKFRIFESHVKNFSAVAYGKTVRCRRNGCQWWTVKQGNSRAQKQVRDSWRASSRSRRCCACASNAFWCSSARFRSLSACRGDALEEVKGSVLNR